MLATITMATSLSFFAPRTGHCVLGTCLGKNGARRLDLENIGFLPMASNVHDQFFR